MVKPVQYYNILPWDMTLLAKAVIPRSLMGDCSDCQAKVVSPERIIYTNEINSG